MDEQKYKLYNDLQGAGWFLDRIESISSWREYAYEWAQADCLNEVVEVLEKLDETEIINFISEIWELEFKALV